MAADELSRPLTDDAEPLPRPLVAEAELLPRPLTDDEASSRPATDDAELLPRSLVADAEPLRSLIDEVSLRSLVADDAFPRPFVADDALSRSVGAAAVSTLLVAAGASVAGVAASAADGSVSSTTVAGSGAIAAGAGAKVGAARPGVESVGVPERPRRFVAATSPGSGADGATGTDRIAVVPVPAEKVSAVPMWRCPATGWASASELSSLDARLGVGQECSPRSLPSSSTPATIAGVTTAAAAAVMVWLRKFRRSPRNRNTTVRELCTHTYVQRCTISLRSRPPRAPRPTRRERHNRSFGPDARDVARV